jgi:hypothetical protein
MSSEHSLSVEPMRSLRNSSATSMLPSSSQKAISGSIIGELGEVPARVGVLRAEGGTEGVHVLQSHGEVFSLELTGHRQVGLLGEEVLGVVHLAGGGRGAGTPRALADPRRIAHVQGGDLEHLAGAFGIAAREDRGVHVDEAALLEEAVNGEAHGAAHPRHRADGVRPRPQVRDLPEELEAVPLPLEGVVVLGAFPDDFQIGALNLYALILALAGHKITGRPHRRAVGG